jgi:hypothetical protein
MCGRGNEPR